MVGIEKMPWKRFGLEAAAIVGSILLAFAIDAWWEERQLRYEEQQILQGLQEEFLSIHTVLTAHLAEHLQGIESLENFLFEIEKGLSADSGAIIEAAILEMLSPMTSDLGNGTLQALIGSGRVDIVMNRSLRAKLAAWQGVVDEVWDDQAAHEKMVYELFVPYFVGENIAAEASMRYWYVDWPIPLISIIDDPEAMQRMLEDPKIRILAGLRYGYKRHLTQEFEIAVDAAEAILLEIEKSMSTTSPKVAVENH